MVETCPQPRLIPKHLTASEALNCESSAKLSFQIADAEFHALRACGLLPTSMEELTCNIRHAGEPQSVKKQERGTPWRPSPFCGKFVNSRRKKLESQP